LFKNNRMSLQDSADRIRRLCGNEIRLAVFGVTGFGKSQTCESICQTIAPRSAEYFEAKQSISSCTTDSLRQTVAYRGLSISITDNPGMLDYNGIGADVAHLEEITRGNTVGNVSYHGLFLVVRANVRFDAASQAILDIVMQIYGEDARKHLILIVTHADQLESAADEEKLAENWQTKVSQIVGMQVPTVMITNHSSRSSPKGLTKAASVSAIFGELASLLEAYSQPFVPVQRSQEEIKQIVKKTGERYEIKQKDWEKILSALITIVPMFTSSGTCIIL